MNPHTPVTIGTFLVPMLTLFLGIYVIIETILIGGETHRGGRECGSPIWIFVVIRYWLAAGAGGGAILLAIQGEATTWHLFFIIVIALSLCHHMYDRLHKPRNCRKGR